MKVKDIYSEYSAQTRKLSEFGSKFGFSAIAICWVLREENYSFSLLIVCSLVFCILYFILDVSQYFVSAISLRSLARKLESKINDMKRDINLQEVAKPTNFELVPFVIFILKYPFLLASYLMIAAELLNRIYSLS